MNKTDTTKKIYLTGKVVSAATPKTVIVEVVHQFRHPLDGEKHFRTYAYHRYTPPLLHMDGRRQSRKAGLGET